MKGGVEGHFREIGVDFRTNAVVKTTLLDSVASLVVRPKNVDELLLSLKILREEEAPFHAHGVGSNSLHTGTAESPTKAVIIETSGMCNFKIDSSTGIIVAEQGKKLASVSELAAKGGLTGLEFARDIPGTLAGGIVTAAGHPIHNYRGIFEERDIKYDKLPKSLSQVLRSVSVVDGNGNILDIPVGVLQMENRGSIFTQPENDWLILSATLGLERGDRNEIAAAREVIFLGRKQMRAKNGAVYKPSVCRTLGYSFVLNHESYGGKSASQIIGETQSLPEIINIDGMGHSRKTPNIIANTGKGTAEGYLKIIDQIQKAVLNEHGISLPVEVVRVN